MMNLKSLDVHVKWGGIRLQGGDNYVAEYFEEGEHYIDSGKTDSLVHREVIF